MELSTISSDRLKKIHINKLKAYHHNNVPTNVIITTIIIDVKDYNIVESRHTKKPKPNYICLGCIPNQGNLGLTQNLEKRLMKMTKSESKRKIQKVSYQEHLIITKQENLIKE